VVLLLSFSIGFAIAVEKRRDGRVRYIEFETPRAKQEPRLHAAALCREIA
jgi:hypothetical protein